MARNDEELTEQLRLVKDFADDNQIEFEIDKCPNATYNKVELKRSENMELRDKTTICSLEQHDANKYLGIEEHDGV